MANSRYWQEKIDVNYKNEICEVFELAAQHHLQAFFEEVSREGPIHKAIFTYRLKAGNFTVQAQGPTIANAKLLAAQQVLPELRRLPLPPEKARPNFQKKKKNPTGFWQGLPLFKPHENPVDCLDKLLTKFRGKPAEYTFVDAYKETYPHIVSFQLIAAEQTVVALGLSMTDAKRNAAAKMLNIFGYDFYVTEPKPKLRKEVLLDVGTDSETKNDVPVEVTQGADGTPRENEISPHQDSCAQPEEEPPAEDPELLPVEVTSPEEGPAGLTQEDTSTAVQGDEPQSPVDLQEFLPADVLPMLAAMGVIQNSNGKIQWCEPSLQQETKTPADIMEVTSEISDTFIPDVTREEISASQEFKKGPDVSLYQTPKREFAAGDAEASQIRKVSVNSRSTEPRQGRYISTPENE